MEDKELTPEAKIDIIGEIKGLLIEYVEHNILVNFVNDITLVGARGHGVYTICIGLKWSYSKIRDELKSNLNNYLNSIPSKEKTKLKTYYETLKENRKILYNLEKDNYSERYLL